MNTIFFERVTKKAERFVKSWLYFQIKLKCNQNQNQKHIKILCVVYSFQFRTCANSNLEKLK